MSLASWKREFYRTPADKISKRYALQHSLKKWVGLLSKNRTKHKVSFKDGTLYDKSEATIFGNDNRFEIHSGSCALCYYYHDNDKEDCY